MGTRGRGSIAELVVVNGPHGAVANRPDPPKDLNAAEAVEWLAIVASMPPEHFAGRPSQILLSLLCRHVVEARFIDRLIADGRKKNKPDREYEMLQLKESVMIMRLCRSMRLTHQSLYRAESAKLRPVAGPLWQDGRPNKPWHRC